MYAVNPEPIITGLMWLVAWNSIFWLLAVGCILFYLGIIYLTSTTYLAY
jgi:hypothetical protein